MNGVRMVVISGVPVSHMLRSSGVVGAVIVPCRPVVRTPAHLITYQGYVTGRGGRGRVTHVCFVVCGGCAVVEVAVADNRYVVGFGCLIMGTFWGVTDGGMQSSAQFVDCPDAMVCDW